VSVGRHLDAEGCWVDDEPCYVAAAGLTDVLWEQFEFLMNAGADPEHASQRDLDRMAEVSAILLDPWRAKKKGKPKK
jgi:hypothetical protein